jgi:hypothetical protein
VFYIYFYIFPLYFIVYLQPVSRTHGQFKALFKRNFLIYSFIFPFMFYGSTKVVIETI